MHMHTIAVGNATTHGITQMFVGTFFTSINIDASQLHYSYFYFFLSPLGATVFRFLLTLVHLSAFSEAPETVRAVFNH